MFGQHNAPLLLAVTVSDRPDAEYQPDEPISWIFSRSHVICMVMLSSCKEGREIASSSESDMMQWADALQKPMTRWWMKRWVATIILGCSEWWAEGAFRLTDTRTTPHLNAFTRWRWLFLREMEKKPFKSHLLQPFIENRDCFRCCATKDLLSWNLLKIVGDIRMPAKWMLKQSLCDVEIVSCSAFWERNIGWKQAKGTHHLSNAAVKHKISFKLTRSAKWASRARERKPGRIKLSVVNFFSTWSDH